MRAFALVALVLLLAGCNGAPPAPDPTPEPAPENAELRFFAIDGRWPFEPARAEALIARAGAPTAEGALVMGEALGPRVVDFVGLDARAAETLGITPPAPGEAIVARGLGLAVGDALPLRSHAWPTPYMATYFEMERTPTCERAPATKLCSNAPGPDGLTRLRLRVDEAARDAAFLPDLVELGPGGRPAYWNGSFEGPDGTSSPFSAVAPLDAPPRLAEFSGAMAAGDWNVTFRLEANGKLAAAGAAGIVRVREPGYLWFDDRLQEVPDASAQARAILANATPTQTQLRVTRVDDAPPLGADIILAYSDAQALAGTDGATALLVRWTATQERAVTYARGPDGFTMALRARPLPQSRPTTALDGALVFAAPSGVDITSLPPIEGGGAPELALAGRSPIGEPITLEGAKLDGRLLLLAHADGVVGWGLPEGGRWTETNDALENLSRSRTLALGSPDLVTGAFATGRIEVGTGNATRTLVAIGGVLEGPAVTLWTSAPMVAGAGQPVAPRVILPLGPGADRDTVASRAAEAWSSYGLVLDR